MKIPTLIAFLVLLLAGCVAPGGLVPQQSTGLDVRAKMGRPTDIRFDRNGEELWEYAEGPAGIETHLVRIGKDGRVLAVTQLLTEERLYSLEPGKSTKQDARHILGRPSDESFLATGEAWSWRFSFAGQQRGNLVVSFNPDSTVKERMVMMDFASGDRSKSDK